MKLDVAQNLNKFVTILWGDRNSVCSRVNRNVIKFNCCYCLFYERCRELKATDISTVQACTDEVLMLNYADEAPNSTLVTTSLRAGFQVYLS